MADVPKSPPADTPQPLDGWRTVKELTVALRFKNDTATRGWLKTQHVTCVYRGRFIMAKEADVEAALRAGQPQPSRPINPRATTV